MMLIDEFIPISVATLSGSVPPGVDLYTHETATDRFRLYKRADYPLDDADLQHLKDRKVRNLFISRREQEQYQQYLRSLLFDESACTPLKTRVGAMNDVVRDVLQKSFASEDIEKTVANASQLSEVMVELVCDEEFVADQLLHVLHHDYTTFTHSANVAHYAVILAKEQGYPSEELRQIAAGALLHDLGKLGIAENILCKPERLDEFERRRIEEHPRDGFMQLCRQQNLSKGQLMMVYQHHEKVDGTGYPVGCVGDEIHPWARLCAVVDVFEALTSFRPYREPMKHARAIELMTRESDQAFDTDLFQCWKTIVESCSIA